MKQQEKTIYIKFQRKCCVYCKFYDGHDMCLHKKNFGAIAEGSIWNCISNDLVERKR